MQVGRNKRGGVQGPTTHNPKSGYPPVDCKSRIIQFFLFDRLPERKGEREEVADKDHTQEGNIARIKLPARLVPRHRSRCCASSSTSRTRLSACTNTFIFNVYTNIYTWKRRQPGNWLPTAMYDIYICIF